MAGDGNKLGLGVDTGGTYTDAAVVDLHTRKVVSRAKSPTTYNDLSIGLRGAIDGALEGEFDLDDIRLVGVSTTLATNSVLEGKGGKVGLIGIGFKPKEDWFLGEDRSAFISGGHNVSGGEASPLDMDEVAEAVDDVSPGMDAMVVSSLFSVYNQGHENRVKRLIKERIGLPVVAGHELTGELGIMERTVTAVLNARLIPILDTFLDDVTEALEHRGVHAPMMVFKGDGSLMNIFSAKDRPVETILSGPAASSMGGRILAGLEDCIVVDVGGTSTDIAFLDGGFPRIVPEGASIGQWRTRVRAVDMWTAALGGDSEVRTNPHGEMWLSSERVIPLCLAAERYPGLLDRMREQSKARFLVSNTRKRPGLSDSETEVLDFVEGNGPSTLEEVKSGVSVVLVDRYVQSLKHKNMLVGIGLTPTDVLRAMDRYQEGDREASLFGVGVAAHILGKSDEDLMDQVLNRVASTISGEVIKKVLMDEGRALPNCKACGLLLDNITRESSSQLMQLQATFKRKVVGIGAPAHVYLPMVQDRLG
ncbi:MAG: hydantoinase/oxoprolinase family protein, partial [Methanomassiliicoccales archaeon]